MIFPLSIPGVISGITMVFVPSVSTFVISQMLGSGKNLLVGDLIDLQFMGGAYNPHLGSAIALVMIILIFICMWIMNKFDDGSSEEGGLLLMKKFFKNFYLLLIFLFLYAPIVVLMIFSFNDSNRAACGTALPPAGMSSCFRMRIFSIHCM